MAGQFILNLFIAALWLLLQDEITPTDYDIFNGLYRRNGHIVCDAPFLRYTVLLAACVFNCEAHAVI